MPVAPLRPDVFDNLLPRLFAAAPGAPPTLRRALLTGPRNPVGAEALQRVEIKPVEIKGHTLFQFEYRRGQKALHRNCDSAGAVAEIQTLLPLFREAQFFAADTDYHATPGKSEAWTVRRRPHKSDTSPTPLPLAHNRAKNYLLPEGTPVPFLVRLGVMTREGRVVASRWDKFRQVNRFLEMVADTLPALPTGRPLRIVDFGSGKSYLTFALYHYLRVQQEREVEIVGLDLKADVIADCARIARDLGYDDLRFAVGDIGSYGGNDAHADMVVTLHACDTATDDALAKAVTWGASVILSVPCCQHELFRHIQNDALAPLLKHGLFRERLSALVTDALRAEMLERCGYAVQVLEFVDMEHTPKNLLLRATRKGSTTTPDEPADYTAFRDFWHIAPYIETAFARESILPADS